MKDENKFEVVLDTNDEGEIEVKSVKAVKVADLPGVGPATVDKLQCVGYNDLMSIAVATPGQLMEATGMGESAAKKIIAQARSSLDMGFESGLEVLKRREAII